MSPRMSNLALAAAFLLALPGPSVFADSHYVVVFGAQRPYVNEPTKTHSFATFVRLREAGHAEVFSISWYPATMRPRLLRRPEPGVNLTLEETLALCDRNRMVVGTWGPFQIEPELWERAAYQKAKLESGQVLYQMFDRGSRDGDVSNCVHALGWVVREPGRRTPYVRSLPGNWGESGSYWIALTYRPW